MSIIRFEMSVLGFEILYITSVNDVIVIVRFLAENLNHGTTD